MPNLSYPGTYVEETLLPVQVSAGPEAPPVAFVGEHLRGPQAFTLCTSWTQFVQRYGGFAEGPSDLAIAAHQFFANGGRNLYIGRVVGSGAASASLNLDDRRLSGAATILTVSAANPGAWGNQIYITVVDNVLSDHFDVLVYYGGTNSGNLVERFDQCNLDVTSQRFVHTVINGVSNFITVEYDPTNDATPGDALPEEVTTTALTGGSNGSEVASQDLIDKVQELDTLQGPIVLAVPGVSDSTTLNSVISYVDGREDIFLIIDAPSGKTPAEAVSFVEELTETSYAAVYYPWILIRDPAIGGSATRLVAPSGAVAGQFSRTDAMRGVWKAPAGSNTRLASAVGLERNLTNAELGVLNNGHVNAIKRLQGSGIVIYGARTIRRTVEADRYVPVRRTLIYLKRVFNSLTEFAIHETNDERLWRAITSTLSGFLSDFWTRGGLRGANASEAFYVKCDSDINNQSSIAMGIVNVEVGVALQYPAEFVVIRLAQMAGGAQMIEITA